MQVNRSGEEILSGKLAIEGELAKVPGAVHVSRAKVQYGLLAFAGTHLQPILGRVVARLSLFESPHSTKHERSCHVPSSLLRLRVRG